MVMDQLCITLEGSRVSKDGVPVASFLVALGGVQGAVRLMVEHLGGRAPKPGRPPKWARDQSSLRLAATRRGSFVAELTLEAPPDRQSSIDNYGPPAIDALLRWDGSEDSTLPKAVTDKLYEIPHSLPDDLRVWLGTVDYPLRVEVRRTEHHVRPKAETETALLQGWLKEVNWSRRTAQLHRYHDSYVQLRFGPALDEAMSRYATQFVEVRGRGQFSDNNEWVSVQVEQVDGMRSRNESFDLDGFLNDPDPKIFDSEEVVTTSEPFDVDEFIRIIHEGREVGREESSI